MKKSLLILLVIIASGCSMQRISTLGITEKEFLSRAGLFATLAEKSEERTVYKIPNSQEGNRTTYLYYYFIDDRLARIDEGERQPNVVIEHVDANPKH